SVPIRDFDPRGMGWLPSSRAGMAAERLLLLAARSDDPRGWVQAGEALEHVWLALTMEGFWASPLTQLIEVRVTNDRLRGALGLTTYPQILLRVGRAPDTVRTPRRPAAEVILDARHGQRRGAPS